MLQALKLNTSAHTEFVRLSVCLLVYEIECASECVCVCLETSNGMEWNEIVVELMQSANERAAQFYMGGGKDRRRSLESSPFSEE